MRSGRRVAIEVVEVQGSGACPMGMDVGSVWVVEDGWTPEGMCGSAYHTVFPYLYVLRFGGSLPWEEESGVAHICCPDPENPVVFRMRALDDAG